MIRAVIDTNVVFEGLTTQGNASAIIIEAWLQNQFTACVTNAVAKEYVATLSNKLSTSRWQKISVVLRALLTRAQYVDTYFCWRPSSPDPADDMIIDAAMNANALLVTKNNTDFLQANTKLGLNILTPSVFIEYLAHQLEEKNG